MPIGEMPAEYAAQLHNPPSTSGLNMTNMLPNLPSQLQQRNTWSDESDSESTIDD